MKAEIGAGKKLLAPIFLFFIITLTFIAPACADTTITVSNMAGLQGNASWQLYFVHVNSSGIPDVQCLGTFYTGSNDSVTGPDNTRYMIVMTPNVENSFMNDPMASISYYWGMLPIYVAYMPSLLLSNWWVGVVILLGLVFLGKR